MCAALLQSAVIAIRRSGHLHACYRRIGDRRGAGKAIIATLRKLLAVIYEALHHKDMNVRLRAAQAALKHANDLQYGQRLENRVDLLADAFDLRKEVE